MSLEAQKIGEKLYKASADSAPKDGATSSQATPEGEAKAEPEVKDAETKEGEKKE